MQPRLARLVLALSLLGAGCGGGGEAVPPERDPTLRGLVARMEAAGLEVGAKVQPRGHDGQKAAIGRAAGLANELAGAGIRTDLPTETQERVVEGHTLILERFATPEKAAEVVARRRHLEEGFADAGNLVYLQAGDKVLTLRVRGGRALPGGKRLRPSSPPAPEVVAAVEEAFAAAGP